MIKACLNGVRAIQEHPALPVGPLALALDAQKVHKAGAEAVHIHPRRQDATASQSLHPADGAAAIQAIRDACPSLPVGLTTIATIELDVLTRLQLIKAWEVLPDFASVNFNEEGCEEICSLLAPRGVGIEAGISSVTDVKRLLQSDFATSCLRILIEPEEETIDLALTNVEQIEQALDDAGITTPRLLHGYEATAWPLLEIALRRSYDVRIGFEDVLKLPDGTIAEDNSVLVAFAAKTAEVLRTEKI